MKSVVQGQLVHLTEMRDGDAEWLRIRSGAGLLRNLSADALHPWTAANIPNWPTRIAMINFLYGTPAPTMAVGW